MGNTESKPPLGDVRGADDVKTKMRKIIASNSVPEAQRKIQELLPEWRNTPINIGVIGEQGVGKSSFINNMSGRELAKVGTIETTSDAKPYQHPDNQQLVFWDLPGFLARFYPTIEEYLRSMMLQRFDLILFLYKDGFKQSDKTMYDRITQEIGKPLFLVRSKFDGDMQGGRDVETEKRNIDSELEAYGIPLQKNHEKRCYFIANRTHDEPTCHLYDYGKLITDITHYLENDSKVQGLLYDLHDYISKAPLGDVRGADDVKTKMRKIIASNSVPEAQRQIQELLSEWKNTPINIGVIGKRGVGKSSFINNMSGRELAKVGTTETTSDAKPYQHPDNQQLVFWDLPGFLARFYPTIEGYLRSMKLQRFDVVLFLYNDRFEQSDKTMYNRITQEIRKPLFLVRSKFDRDVQDCRDGRDVEKEKRNIDSELEDYGISLQKNHEKRCYFIANRTHDKPTCYLYDYGKLITDIIHYLENHSKVQGLLYALKNRNREVVNLKEKQLRDRILMASFKACLYGAIPIPGCELVLNAKLLVGEIKFMAEVLGIIGDIQSYQHEANPNFSAVKIDCLQRCSEYFAVNGMLTYVKTFGLGVALTAADEVFKLVPGLGSLISSSVSFGVTHMVLTNVLNDFMELVNIDMDDGNSIDLI